MMVETIAPAPASVPLSLGRAARLERRDLGESAAYLTIDAAEATVTLGFSERQLLTWGHGGGADDWVWRMLAATAFLTGGAWTFGDRMALGALARAALRGRAS